jgi:hypothetical protein
MVAMVIDHVGRNTFYWFNNIYFNLEGFYFCFLHGGYQQDKEGNTNYSSSIKLKGSYGIIAEQ